MKLKSLLSRILLLLALVMLAFNFAVFLSGCAHTASGLDREAALYATSTNALALVARYAAPLVPAPYNTAVPVVLGLVSAILGAWNHSQGKRLAMLENGKKPPN